MRLDGSREMLDGVVADVLTGVDDLEDPHVVPPAWATVVELDWPLVGIPEGFGGAGGTVADVVALTEAVARQAASVPLHETQLARSLVGMAAVDLPASAVIIPVDGRALTITAGDGTRVDGEVTGVGWASIADHLVVGIDDQLLWLPADTAGVQIEPGVDVANEPFDTVTFSSAQAQVVGDRRAVEALRNGAALGRAAGLVGAAQGAAKLTIEHVAAREQFGRPLAKFQLVRAGIADMAAELELARGALSNAVDAHLDDRDMELRTGVALSSAARTATLVLRTSHQLHGAIGVTREHALHRFTRRLWAWRDRAGSQRSWEGRLGELAANGGPDEVWRWFTSTGDGAA